MLPTLPPISDALTQTQYLSPNAGTPQGPQKIIIASSLLGVSLVLGQRATPRKLLFWPLASAVHTDLGH